MQRADVGAEPREHLAPIPEGHEVVGTPLDGLEPQDRAALCRYLSSRLRLTSRPATERRRYAGSFSYMSFYHIYMVKEALPLLVLRGAVDQFGR